MTLVFRYNNPHPTFRKLGAVLFLVCFGLVGAAIVISSLEHLEPCPLCIMQRVAFMLVGGMGLLAAIYPPAALGWRRAQVGLALTFALIGAGIASWHVYLQYAPPRLTCGPDLAYMMSNWAPAKWLPAVFRGAGECTKIDWMLWGVSMPTWSALCFYGMVFAAMTYLIRQKY